MIKKFLTKLINWESVRESNWTMATRKLGQERSEREQSMAESREKIRKEDQRWEILSRQVPKTTPQDLVDKEKKAA